VKAINQGIFKRFSMPASCRRLKVSGERAWREAIKNRKGKEHMKRIKHKIMIEVMVLFCISVTFAPAYAAERDGAPKAQLPKDVYDFGTVYEGPDVFQHIVIKNIGNADLKVTRVSGG
jgi:hypothetical protein